MRTRTAHFVRFSMMQLLLSEISGLKLVRDRRKSEHFKADFYAHSSINHQGVYVIDLSN